VLRRAYRQSGADARRVILANGFRHYSWLETAPSDNPVWSQTSPVSSSNTPPFHGLYGRSRVCSGLVVAAWSTDDRPCSCAYNTTRAVLFRGPPARWRDVWTNKDNRDEHVLIVCLVVRDVRLCSLRSFRGAGGSDGDIVRATKGDDYKLHYPNHLNET
jgi:hypothetical protein